MANSNTQHNLQKRNKLLLYDIFGTFFFTFYFYFIIEMYDSKLVDVLLRKCSQITLSKCKISLNAPFKIDESVLSDMLGVRPLCRR